MESDAAREWEGGMDLGGLKEDLAGAAVTFEVFIGGLLDFSVCEEERGRLLEAVECHSTYQLF